MDALNQNNKRSINIDFAPMVDLGFLLITFFIFTTELTKPKAFGLSVPDDSDTTVRTESPESSSITLQLKGDGVIDFYEGRKEQPLQTGTLTIYQQNSLRTHLINKRNRIQQQLGSDSNYTVVIQPNANTSYKEMIDVLDEMQILAIKKYVLVDAKE